MRRYAVHAAVLMGLVAAASGCETAKSSNPTSPSVAGPMAGISITSPKLLEPGASSTIANTAQPITLLIENSSSNSQRAVTYIMEIATDSEFSTMVFSRDGILPGSGGRTALRLSDALAADRTYYWRAKATDGANASPYSATMSFAIYIPAILGIPTPLSPIGDIRLSGVRPECVVRNSTRSGPIGAVSYTFEISESDVFSSIAAVFTVPEATNQTRFLLGQDLKYGTRYFWRVRASDPRQVTEWSATQRFLTQALAPTPTPPPTPTPTPPGTWPKTGDEVVAWANRNYPGKLAAGVSTATRVANMAFLRDRMIEAGICGGMNLAWNLKRGGPTISVDYLDVERNGRWYGVDIGSDYDNTAKPLHLYWGEGATDYIFPKTYLPRPTCQ